MNNWEMSRFKEIHIDTLNGANKWDVNTYPSEGIFLVTDTSISGKELLIVNKKVSMVLILGFEHDWNHTLEGLHETDDNPLLFKLQVLKLTGAVEEGQYKQLLAMMASRSQIDYEMARDSIKTLLNTKT